MTQKTSKNNVVYHNFSENVVKQEYIVAYYRVSTKSQYEKGFGIDVQKEIINKFIKRYNYILMAEFEEYQSGTKTDRKILKEAMDYTFKTGAILVVAKLDRLARNLDFFNEHIVKTKLRFKALDYDMQEDSAFWLSIIASFAEKEAQYISTRTREALEQARKRGVVLGRKKGTVLPTDKINGERLAEARREFSRKALISVKPILEKIGHYTPEEQALELSKQGFRNFNGNIPNRNNIINYRKKLNLPLYEYVENMEITDEELDTDEEQEKKEECLKLLSGLNSKDLQLIMDKFVGNRKN